MKLTERQIHMAMIGITCRMLSVKDPAFEGKTPDEVETIIRGIAEHELREAK